MNKDTRTVITSALPHTYWSATRQPNACLAFLLPLAIAYEIGAFALRPGGHAAQGLVAPNLIQHFIAWLGADAVWVPGVALVLTLVVWRLLAKRPPPLRAPVLLLMMFECVVLTLPLFVLGAFLQQTLPGPPPRFSGKVVLALGAGIYEELVFRFYLFGGLAWLLSRKLGVRRLAAVCIAGVVATIAFAACHMEPIGAEPFAWPRFLVLAVAGAYLAVLFLFRGLGIATGAHAAFNIIALWM